MFDGVFEGRARLPLLDQAIPADAEEREETLGRGRIAFIDAGDGAVAARHQNARLGKFLRQPQGFDEAIGSTIEFYAVARRVHLIFEGAAEHDHALQAIGIGGGLCEALLETLHQQVAGRGVERNEEDEGRTGCAEDT
ncbi:hypothetical protein ACVIRM_000984 [Rhizobium laguerreae]